MPRIKCSYDYVVPRLKPVIDDIARDIELARETKTKPNEAKLTAKLNAKLNTILRMQQPMNLQEAIKEYNSKRLYKKFLDVLNIVDYINVVGNVMYILDKTSMCSFMGITLNTYQFMLQDASIDPSVQEIMKQIEDYLIQQAQQSTEIGIRQDKAVERRMTMKGEYGGNEMQIGKKAQERIITAEVNKQELNKKLATTYNFLEGGDKDE